MADIPSQIESLEDVIGNFLVGLKPLFEFIEFARKPGSAAVVRQAFEDWQRHFQQQEKTLVAFAIKHNLIGVERHFTDEQLVLLMTWTVEHGDEVLNRRLAEFCTINEIEEMVSSWSSVPYLTCRKQICGDAVEAYRAGLHSLIIPALFPLAEGLAAEIIHGDPKWTDTVKRAAEAQMNHPASDAKFDSATFDIVKHSFYARQDFGQSAPPETFNRHRILHGRSSDYWSAANSIRAFLLVDAVADMWSRMSARP